MKNNGKTKNQIKNELKDLRRRVAEFEQLEIDCRPVEEALRQSRNFNRSVLMSLRDHIAVLDRKGNILDVNTSWMQFAHENDAKTLDRIVSGANYLEVCRKSSDLGDETAKAALEGIRSVIDNSRLRFEMEYPCDSPTEKRWFHMTVLPFKGHKGGVIVTHSNITRRKLAELKLRDALSEIEQLKNQLEAESAYLQEEIKLEHNFDNIIGNSDALKYVLYKVEQVAATDTSVLILGETGTGKELIARAIHSNSPRKRRPLVKVNCAALPANLIESELFGHEKGAFTGAQTKRQGRFELANGTTLFLDEIGELPLDLQSKLLRVIETGEFERLGSSRTIKVDVRIVAATNRSLEKEVKVGLFREDLWYRLNVFPLTAPPLRDRTEDIPLLVNWFVDKYSKRIGKKITRIPKGLIKALQNYSWPGNVRELENVIERAVIHSREPVLQLAEKLENAHELASIENNGIKTFAEMEKDYIIRVLNQTNWKIEGKHGAAEILDINPGTLRSRLKRLDIQRPSRRG